MALPYEVRVEVTNDPAYVLVTEIYNIREVGCPMIVNPWLSVPDEYVPEAVVVRNVVRVEDALGRVK